jgi:glycosyltransferase involved in cell wall biosynthesis
MQIGPTGLSSSITIARDVPRVLFVNQTARLGGGERVLYTVADGIGSSPTVFLFEDGPLRQLLQQAGVATRVASSPVALQPIRRDGGMLNALPAGPALLRIVRELTATARQHDFVIANSQKAFVVAALAAWIADRPLIWWLHDILSDRHFGRVQIWLDVLLANHLAQRVMVPSRAVANAFIQAGGAAELVAVVPNGVRIPTLSTDRTATRSALGLEPGFTVGVFSRIAPWKGQHVVLNAIARLPDVRCVIAGAPLFGEDLYLRRLHDLVERWQIADRVRFLGHCDNVEAFMRAVDVVVHPSVDPEPFGLTLVEAMLQETPVVAADDGATREILRDGTLGALVAPGDADALVSALLRLREAPEPVADMCRLARRSAEVRFGADEMRQNVVAVLRDVMDVA